MLDIRSYFVEPGERVALDRWPADDDGGLDKDAARERFKQLTKRLDELQELLYADGSRALLVVLQAMDTGGKDSTIRAVFGPLNAQGCRVANFKAPSTLERSHDFLWRVHQQVPVKGNIVVFNRSHYEDVLVVRVKKLAPESRWRPRFDHINAFEKLLVDEGTVVVKFYLHITKAYQKKRLQRRLDKFDETWKFNPADLAERARWGEYMTAFEEALGRCSKPWAPWYVVPAEKRWFRNLLVAEALAAHLESLDLKFP
ncbi:MAG: polyphosphate kinase 2 family protein, partial [Gammaproteobacteria bacterium]|nr:polyphosphate kinase 2 family protein [Gammaproteobacteria bacterium]